MTTDLGDAKKARTVFDDVHLADSPAAPDDVDPTRRLPHRPRPARPGGRPARSTARASGRSAAPPTRRRHPRAGSGAEPAPWARSSPSSTSWRPRNDESDAPATSNAVLVDGRHTASGRPIAVFGPQVGYQMPSFLVEKDVHGPGIDARGVGFAGIDAYVLLGRGRDYAWSATSSGADNTDTFVLRLCDPSGGAATVSSMGYEHDGKCRSITTFDHTIRPATVGGGPPGAALTWTVQRAPDYGPVVRRGTLRDGTPIAITRKRSTYGDEISSAVGFQRLNDPAVMRAGYPAFKTATGAHIGFTFNWFYVDGVTIGYEHSCKCPLRARTASTPTSRSWAPGSGTGPGTSHPHTSRPTSTRRAATSRRGTTSRPRASAPRTRSSPTDPSIGYSC